MLLVRFINVVNYNNISFRRPFLISLSTGILTKSFCNVTKFFRHVLHFRHRRRHRHTFWSFFVIVVVIVIDFGPFSSSSSLLS